MQTFWANGPFMRKNRMHIQLFRQKRGENSHSRSNCQEGRNSGIAEPLILYTMHAFHTRILIDSI